MPNSILSGQTTLNKAKFLEFGTKNANLATLELTRMMQVINRRSKLETNTEKKIQMERTLRNECYVTHCWFQRKARTCLFSENV